MTEAAVSVIIPTLNRLDNLKRVLAAVKKQSLQPREIIVVGVGSADATAKFVTSLGGRISYLRQGGMFLPNARNCGILKSTGDIIAFLDDDAIPVHGWLEEIVKTYEMGEMIGGVGGWIVGMGLSKKMSDRLLRVIEGVGYTGSRRVLSKVSKFVYEVDRLSGCNMSFRKGVLEQIAYANKESWFFDELYDNTSLCEDTDACLRVRKSGYKLLLNTKAQVYHLKHVEHLTGKAPAYASFNKLLSQHENSTYFHLKCMYYHLAEIGLPRILLSRAYLSLLYLLRSAKHPASRSMHLNDFFATFLGLKEGYLKFLKHRSLVRDRHGIVNL